MKRLAWLAAVFFGACVLGTAADGPAQKKAAGDRGGHAERESGKVPRPMPGPKEADGKGRDGDEETSRGGRGEAGPDGVSESFNGEGGASAIEAVPGFDPKKAFETDAALTKEESARAAEQLKELQDLPPIEKVVFGDAPETVCGTDDRVRVTPTTVAPWRWTCQLIITLKGGAKARGTGWFIGPCTVMTAGHCVHTGGGGGSWAERIEVIPGMDGAGRPYGSQASSTFRSVRGWTDDGKPEYDYGAVILSDASLGRRVGWFGFAVLGDNELKNLAVNTAGYPGDKPSGTQWFTAGPVTGAEARRLAYMLDTYPGQSGSCVWRLKDGQRHAVGIHNYGGCPNRATRITQEVFDNMLRWKNLCQ